MANGSLFAAMPVTLFLGSMHWLPAKRKASLCSSPQKSCGADRAVSSMSESDHGVRMKSRRDVLTKAILIVFRSVPFDCPNEAVSQAEAVSLLLTITW